MSQTSEDGRPAGIGSVERRRRLRRAAVVAGVPAGAYLVLVASSLLGGPRIGASLIPLPDAGGPEVVRPVSAPQAVLTPIGGITRPEPPSRGLPTARPTTLPSTIPSPGPTVDPAGRPTLQPGETCPPTASPGDPKTSTGWPDRSLAADRQPIVPPRAPELPTGGATAQPSDPILPGPTSGPPSGPTAGPTSGPSDPSTSGPVVPPTSEPSPPAQSPSPSPTEPADPTLTGTLLDLLNGVVPTPSG